MYPRLVIDLEKIKDNVRVMRKLTDKANCELGIVTKSFCADNEIVKAIDSVGVDFLADARIQNIESYKELNTQKLMLRLPQHCEIEQVVKFADISLNSELSTICMIDEEARRQDKIHKVVLMIDLGDLREGIFFENEDVIMNTVEEILKLKNVKLHGVGVNLTCYGAVIPKNDNLSKLVEIARKIESKFEIKLDMISGGNSSSVYLIDKGELPEGINSLRLGEAFVLGNETAYGNRIEGTHNDAIIFEAQIIELKEKPTLPIGEIGLDAFGQKPYYEDKGIAKRAILAVGKQDTDIGSMIPIDSDIEILGASSDHMIMDVTNSKIDYKVGDIISFRLAYGGLINLSISKYVDRFYK